MIPPPDRDKRKPYKGTYIAHLKATAKRAQLLHADMAEWGDNMERAKLTHLPMYVNVRVCALGISEAILAMSDAQRHLEAAKGYLIDGSPLGRFELNGRVPRSKTRPDRHRFIVALLYQLTEALEARALWCRAAEDHIALQRIMAATAELESGIARMEGATVPYPWNGAKVTR
jgi:hypothetical protein